MTTNISTVGEVKPEHLTLDNKILNNINPLTASIMLSYGRKWVIFNPLIEFVCSICFITFDEFLSKSKERKRVTARYLTVVLLAKYYPNLNDIDLAEIINRDRTTIIHAFKVHESLYDKKADKEGYTKKYEDCEKWILKNLINN